MAKYVIYNKKVVKGKFKETKTPTLSKFELDKVGLYESFEGLPLSERLEAYGQTSDVLL